jgi:S1-C subfamily serine protease
MEKIVISTNEVANAVLPISEDARPEAKLPSPVPWWARLAMSPLVLVLPLLCLVVLVLRVALRGLPPRTRFAWLAFLSTLLIVSGLLTSAASVVIFSISPAPPMASQGLSEMDSRTSFPALPNGTALSAAEVSSQLKPLVVVISPAAHGWFSRSETPSSSFGAGILLQAGPRGYLIATARHVIDGTPKGKGGDRALVAALSGTWSGADVVARHNALDLALLWLPRNSGEGSFVLPVDGDEQVADGETVFLIGHPQGLRFTLSTGIISRIDSEILQTTAPVSPGNSGGPMFDDRGRLAGIVTSMVDRGSQPNAENLNFAVRAGALLSSNNWSFLGDGRRELDEFIKAQQPQPRPAGTK